MTNVNIEKFEEKLIKIQKILKHEKRRMLLSEIARKGNFSVSSIQQLINYPVAHLKYGIQRTDKKNTLGRTKYWYEKNGGV